MEEKAVMSLFPFVIEEHEIESIIGTPKSVKKLKNKTLLVETCWRSQTENLLKVTFFGLGFLSQSIRVLIPRRESLETECLRTRKKRK